jgi:SAM-dependent methyltransferase
MTDDWFEEWFGEEYLALYPHRDGAEARRVASLIAARVGLPVGRPALDLACGAGRHQRELCEHWWTVGLDLSPSLLRVARTEDPSAPLVRADMRHLPFRDGAFDLVVNLFTSFGYFRDDRAHRRVVAEVARVTRPGGWFVLDYLNAAHVRRTLVPIDKRQVGSTVVRQKRAISADGRFVRKLIEVGELGRTFVERVRLFEPAELVQLLEGCGYLVVDVLGDYDGRQLDEHATRTILVGQLA